MVSNIATQINDPLPERAVIIRNNNTQNYEDLWSDQYVEDIVSIFEKVKTPGQFKVISIRLRKQVFEKGSSRDIELSMERFLLRKPSKKPYLDKLSR